MSFEGLRIHKQACQTGPPAKNTFPKKIGRGWLGFFGPQGADSKRHHQMQYATSDQLGRVALTVGGQIVVWVRRAGMQWQKPRFEVHLTGTQGYVPVMRWS